MKLFIGLMSGTSMDGIDAALIDTETNKVIEGITYPYTEDLKKDLKYVVSKPIQSLGYFSQLNTRIGREFAQAALKLLSLTPYKSADITAIGSHGQTLCHDSAATIPYTVQLGCPHTIAHETDITVVADFRTRDLVNGGQGAPFAPIYHQAIFSADTFPLAIVNIGGIANITYLKNSNEVLGYDVGPGNCLMDEWILHCLSMNFDKNGEWAGSGTVIESLLSQLLNDKFFKQQAPKSIGKEYFSHAWLKPFLRPIFKPEDIQATLLQLTARIIAYDVIEQSIPPCQLLVCGGGVHNQVLMSAIKKLLPEISVVSTDILGINPDYIEALMFAWLANKCLEQVPLDLSAITGAKKPAILGVIYPKSIDKRGMLGCNQLFS